jgi:hypothetical protein
MLVCYVIDCPVRAVESAQFNTTAFVIYKKTFDGLG